MLGKILTICKTGAVVSIDKDSNEIKDLINLHVIFEDNTRKIIG